MGTRGYTFWTAYRKHYVRTSLARGDSRALICERLGCTGPALSYGIGRYGLDKPEASDAA